MWLCVALCGLLQVEVVRQADQKFIRERAEKPLAMTWGGGRIHRCVPPFGLTHAFFRSFASLF